MPNEIVGGISVAITVDLPALQAQFTQAQTMAQATGQAMAASFNAAQAPAAGLVATVQQLNAAIAPAGQAASTAASSFVTLGDAWTAIQAIGIGETILEVGKASLEAYGNLQRATTALTALTGSATQADSEIKALKQLAQDDALSFPELLQANQRLTALGVSASQIPAALRASADAAAAMNTSLINVTNAIDRMAASGSVAGRNLTQLGLTTNDLAKVMGVSLDQVSKKFHSLDESDRIAYLTEAMGKFGGTAEQVAGTLVGSFNRLENAITFAFQSIGESIAPAAKDLTDLAITVLPSVATAISNLAAPAVSLVELGRAVADAKTQFLEAAAAAIPFGQQLENLATAAGAGKTSFMDLIPGISGVKTAMDTLTVTIQAYTNTGPQIDAMNKMVANGLRDVASAAKVGGDAFKQAWDLSLLQAGLGNVSGKISEVITEQEKANVTFIAARDAFNQMSQAFQTGTALANGHIVTLQEVQRAMLDLDKAQKALNAGSKDYQDTLAGLTENYNKQQGTIDTLEQTIGQLLAVQDRTAAQDTILAEATTKLTGLLKQQADAHGLVAAAGQGQGKAYDGLVKSADALMTKAIASNVAVTQAKAVLDQLTASEDTSAEHQRAVIAAMEQYKTSLETAGVSTNGFIQVTVNGAKTMVNLGQALKEAKDHAADFVTTTATVPQVVETATGRLNGMVIPLGFIATGLDSIVTIINNKAIPAIKTFTDLHPQLASGLDFATASLKKMNDETEQSIINAGQAIGSQSSYVGALDHTDDAISGTVDNMSRFAASINDATAAGTGFVDHSSAFANSIDKIGASAAKSASAVAAVVKQTNGSLSQFVSDTQVGLNGTNGSLSQFVSDTKSSMGQAQESFKATTGEVNALSIGVKFLAMQMSGLTVFAGSGGIINQNQNPGDLQHQLWLAQNAAGDPAGANGLISILPKVTAALKDQTAATDALAKSSTAAAAATIQYVDGVGNIYDSYQQMVDAVNKNPALGGLWHTITKSMTDLASVPIQSLSGNLDSVSTGLNNLGTAVGTAAQGISTGVQSLSTAQQAAVDYQRVITDTIGSTGEDFARSSNGWAQSADEITARMAADAASMQEILSRDYNAGAHSSDGGGQPGLPSGQITDKNTGKVYPDFATYLAAQLVPAMATNEGAGPQAGLPAGPITDKNSGKVYSDFASYLAAQLPSTAPVTESTGSNPYDYFSRPPASVLPNNPNLATVTSNQQSGPNGAGVTLNIINPVVTSQSQAEMVLSQAINYLRNTAGLKL